MNTDMARIGPIPGQRSTDPHRDFALGLLNVVGELAGMLVAHGIITAEGLSVVMRRREQITREAFTEQQALPAKTLAEVAEIWAKPAALAFPRDAQVIPFQRSKFDQTTGAKSVSEAENQFTDEADRLFSRLPSAVNTVVITGE